MNEEIKQEEEVINTTPPLSIAFAYPHGNGFEPQWIESVIHLLLHEVSKPKEDRILGSILKAGSCYVDGNRNKIAIDFNNTTQDDWLLMIDPDIQFKHDILERLKRLIIENPEASIIAGRVNLLNGLPVFYNINPKTSRQVHQPFAFEGLRTFDLVGTGIIAIKREVFTTLAPKQTHFHWFNRIITTEGIGLGDDFSFCLRAKELGDYKLYGAWEIEGIHWKKQPCRSAYLELEQMESK